MEKGYTKGVIGPILRAKEGGAAIWTGKKKSGIGVSKKGGQEGNKADWREKRGTEGEI